MADSVLYEVTDGLAIITVNRPEAMNALNVATKVALRDAVESAASDPDARAILLTAAGERAFCVGQDLKEHIGLLAEGSDVVMSTVGEHYNPITRALTGAAKPVVVAVNGVAAGAGFGFALAADYRIVADTASFNTSFAGVALTADSGISWTLPRVVGPSRAMDLLLFPRNIGAQDALDLGIANRVVPAASLREEALKVARALAEGPTVAYAALKESVAFGLTHSLTETLDKEDELQSRAGAAEDHRIAVTAFVNKEKPKYVGR
ncbi:enoyl-CoA hydratase/isomerase family protein [Streptomyces acidiscabies]|uniref:Enoyl-CoA hydratase-related protein n=1 Tax=Streptomyces acidiscabies TaxID=42234 RepID=A0AAP6EF59_9ACTN|nr:enoyl-CoA hydratase-related protein [Streptomyces acidiscabies]MBP5937113.1 enoyl-CoA hydratase [Streptomyces sp. LBUM 1476]MBZ3914841.1 enoyl-CoA hydratase/isomerase family protein [Streptomyces acidiscabies]MDX2960707.1 enoyl-CoA hydratase-related protein [Streptomyces acidiscabies]MDX3020757.1 enoyl-CoA hydratase-related protein [Streptomyces acidiscabies]MDX3792872.1 enoyl-CoA hydratase-related protein [Streptomyces acidiscabies]